MVTYVVVPIDHRVRSALFIGLPSGLKASQARMATELSPLFLDFSTQLKVACVAVSIDHRDELPLSIDFVEWYSTRVGLRNYQLLA